MLLRFAAALGALALAGCGQEPAAPKAAATAAKMDAGQYEVTTTVKTLESTDKTPLTSKAKVGDKRTTLGCVGDDGLPAVGLLAAAGDVCELQNPYARSGRMNLTLDCSRKGQGKVMAQLDGNYTADGFTGTVTSNSFFTGNGDYRLVEEVAARKVAGQCTASAPAKA